LLKMGQVIEPRPRMLILVVAEHKSDQLHVLFFGIVEVARQYLQCVGQVEDLLTVISQSEVPYFNQAQMKDVGETFS